MLIFHADKQPLDRFSKGHWLSICSAQKYILKMHFLCGEQHIFYLTLGAFVGVKQEFRLFNNPKICPIPLSCLSFIEYHVPIFNILY